MLCGRGVASVYLPAGLGRAVECPTVGLRLAEGYARPLCCLLGLLGPIGSGKGKTRAARSISPSAGRYSRKTRRLRRAYRLCRAHGALTPLRCDSLRCASFNVCFGSCLSDSDVLDSDRSHQRSAHAETARLAANAHDVAPDANGLNLPALRGAADAQRSVSASPALSTAHARPDLIDNACVPCPAAARTPTPVRSSYGRFYDRNTRLAYEASAPLPAAAAADLVEALPTSKQYD